MTLDSNQQAAVIFMTLPPELTAQLFNELGPAQVDVMTLSIINLPLVSPEMRGQVIGDFLQRLETSEPPETPGTIHLSVSEAEAILRTHGVSEAQATFLAEQLARRSDPWSDLAGALEKLARTQPAKLVEVVVRDYIIGPPEPPRLRALGPSVTRTEEAAIVLSQLSETLSDRLIGALSGGESRRVTLAMSELPYIDGSARADVAVRFMFRCDGKIYPNEELERFVSRNFQGCVDALATDLNPPFQIPPRRLSLWQRLRALF